MVNVTFMMHVNIWRDDMYLNAKDHQELVIGWYLDMNNDKQNLKIEYVISNIFKVTYSTEDEEERCMMDIVADPDDDGNYPVKIKGYYYLIAGKVIDNTISQN